MGKSNTSLKVTCGLQLAESLVGVLITYQTVGFYTPLRRKHSAPLAAGVDATSGRKCLASNKI